MSTLRRVVALAVLLVAAAISPAYGQTKAYPLLQQQGLKLVGTGATGLAAQGQSVAISADGNTAIVGGPNDNSNVGGAWIFKRSGSTWTQQGAELVGTGATGAAQQGKSVAISGDGTTVIIGGPGDNSNAGAAWIFIFTSDGGWTQYGTKLVGTGATGPAAQGTSVALSGDGTIGMVGGPSDNSNAGAAWVFTFNGLSWSQSGSKLVGTGATGAAQQGASVSLAAGGRYALVGGPADNSGVGAAWVWTKTETWVGSKITGTSNTGASAQGTSVAISDDAWVAAIGGPGDSSNAGAVWVFTRTPGGFVQQAKVTGSGESGASQLGSALAISRDGGVILGGGTADNSDNGAEWVFGRTGVATWEQQNSKYLASDAGSGAQFGSALGISADANTAIFGAANETSGAGAIWAYNDNIFFGSVNVSASTTQTIAIQPQSNFTIGNVIVSTQGFGQLDFSIAASQTASHVCEIDSDINSGTPTCSLTVQFAPTAPGVRMGAIQIFDDESDLEATVYVYGIGLGPQVSFFSALINTVAGNGTASFSGDGGLATQAEMNSTWGVSVDPAGDLFIADYENEVIRFVNASTGDISTIVGTPGTAGSTGDGGLASAAELSGPQNPVLDGAGNLYIDDYPNQKIRVVNSVSQFISAYAGNGTAANAGDGGLAVNAEFNGPYAVMIGNNGDAYIAVADVVRRVSAITGIITTVAGTGASGYSGDGGPATSARLNFPEALAMDPSGNLFISDDSNNVIREVSYATGTINTVVGNPDNGGAGFSGDGAAASNAQINDAEGLALDPAGDLYVTDSGNNAVREVNVTTQIINSIAGNGNLGEEGYTGDTGPATAAELAYPLFPGFDGAGNFYFADSDNNVVRVIGGVAPLSFGTVNVGASSDPQDVTVTNNGNATLTFSSIGASGNFNLEGPDTTCTSATQLAPGQSCVLGVVFAPLSGGEIPGNVTLLDNSGGGTQMITLFGVGALVTPEITLTAQPQSANENQSVTFTAVLAPIPGTPRGTVEFCDITNQDVVSRNAGLTRGTGRRPTPLPDDGIYANCDGGTLLGSGNVDATGTATFATTSLSSGARTIVAVYSGNAGLTDALSNSVSETISSVLNTTTTLSADPNPAGTGQTVTFTAAVSPAPTGSPLGSVSFCLGPLGAVTRSVRSNAASASRPARRPGFSPDGNPNPCGGATLLSTVNIDGSGSAVFATASLTLGTDIITAVYSGNAAFAFSISNTISEVISNATVTTTALTVAPNPANAGQTVTLTAKVTPIPTGTPLGSVNFCLGSDNALRMASARPRTIGAARAGRVSSPAPASEAPCGSGSSLNETDIDSTGTAAFSSSNLSSGSLILTAVYSGNATSTASTSDPVTEVINPAFAVTAPQTPFDVPEDGSVQITVTVPPLGGSFTNVVNLSATGLPPGATATFNPPMVTPGSAGAQSVMTVVLAGGKSSASHIPSAPPAGLAGLAIGLLASLCMLAGILAAGFGGTARRRFAALAILFAAVSGSIVVLSACSGGFAGGAVTPKGAYVITVTGTSGSLQASTTVNLVVD